MKSFCQINFAEVTGLFDVGSEVVEVGEAIGILEGLVIEGAKIPTRTLGAVRLVLKVEGATVVVCL